MPAKECDDQTSTQTPGCASSILPFPAGEHIDYEGYSVLPMAIHADCLVAIRAAPGTDKVHLASTQPHLYPPAQFSAAAGAADAATQDGGHAWWHYVRAAHRGVLETLYVRSARGGGAPPSLTGLQVGRQDARTAVRAMPTVHSLLLLPRSAVSSHACRVRLRKSLRPLPL